MKVIDLLNKIANGETLPNKVKLECVNNISEKDCIYTFNPIYEGYLNQNQKHLTEATYLYTLLNLEIEIIEEPIQR